MNFNEECVLNTYGINDFSCDLKDRFRKLEIFNAIRECNLIDIVLYGDASIGAYYVTGNKMYYDEYKAYEYAFNAILSVPFVYARQVVHDVFYNKLKIIRRVKKRINYMLDHVVDDEIQCYFVSLTFNNKYLKKNKDFKDIRRYVREFVSYRSDHFVLNKDFGEKEDHTHRLHFHGCILLPVNKVRDFIISYNKQFGFCKLQVINRRSLCLSRYITKLTFHFVKDSTHNVARECLIYSRQKK